MAIPVLLVKTYREVDEELENDPESGCSALTLYLTREGEERVLYAGNVGNCLAVLFRNGQVIPLTESDSLKLPTAAKEVLQLGYWIHNHSIHGLGVEVSRSLGSRKAQPLNVHISYWDISGEDEYIVMGNGIVGFSSRLRHAAS